MPRFTKFERWAIFECLAHCEASGTELDFYDNIKDDHGEKTANKVIDAVRIIYLIQGINQSNLGPIGVCYPIRWRCARWLMAEQNPVWRHFGEGCAKKHWKKLGKIYGSISLDRSSDFLSSPRLPAFCSGDGGGCN